MTAETTLMPVQALKEISAELGRAIETFLYREARLLDEGRFHEWYELLADDVRYWAPTRANRLTHERDLEMSKAHEVAHFDEDKRSLLARVKRNYTKMAWAEEPPSRTRRLVTNVMVQPTERENEFAVDSNFLVYQNRLETDVQWFVGRREDLLRNTGEPEWRIARRKIILDQNVVLKTISVLL